MAANGVPAAEAKISHPRTGFPPYALLAAVELSGVLGVELKADPKMSKDAAPVITFPDGAELSGLPSVLRYLARVAPPAAAAALYPPGALAACEADAALEFAAAHLQPGAGLEPAVAALDDYLSARTFMAGAAPSLADAAAWGQLAAAPYWAKLRKAAPHAARWFDHLSARAPYAALLEAHGPKKRPPPPPAPAGAPAAKAAGETGSYDVDLPGAEMGKVVTRFPPEPSGYLHVGHAKAALLNQEIARRYAGRLLLRFDDTNPSKEKDEYVDSILADVARLGLEHEPVTYTSDYFPQLEELATRLIEAGHLYADDTPVEVMREERMAGKASARRERPLEETLAAWAAMRAGTEEGRRCCLRLKLDAAAANTALRDPVAYRCNEVPHGRTGEKYKCYPTYDFACPFVDALEGVTHALRTSEYRDREAQFYWVLRLQQAAWPGLPDVRVWDYARLAFVNTVLSKRKLAWFVEEGLVDGWGDPRMPTVQGLLRRGLTVSALREFILSQGASKNLTTQEWDKIWAVNKKAVDPVCPRFTALEAAALVPVALAGAPEPAERVEVPRHAKHPPAGTRTQVRARAILLEQADAALIAPGEEVTLMGWGNAVVESLARAGGAPGAPVEAAAARLHLEGDFKKTKLKLTWLAAGAELTPLELVYFGPLISKRKLEEEDALEEVANRDSRRAVAALGCSNLRAVEKGTILQLERKGYFIVDVAHDPAQPEAPAVLLNIPDGRAKNMPV